MFTKDTENKAVNDLLDKQVTAWNNGGAEGYAKHFAADGTFTNIVGMFFIGNNNFLERHKQIFKGPFNHTVLTQKIISMKFLTPQTVLVECLIRVAGCKPDLLPGIYINEKGQLHTRLLQVLVKHSDDWKIVAYHNVDVKSGIPVDEI